MTKPGCGWAVVWNVIPTRQVSAFVRSAVPMLVIVLFRPEPKPDCGAAGSTFIPGVPALGFRMIQNFAPPLIAGGVANVNTTPTVAALIVTGPLSEPICRLGWLVLSDQTSATHVPAVATESTSSLTCVTLT